jgi:hypothetical protein
VQVVRGAERNYVNVLLRQEVVIIGIPDPAVFGNELAPAFRIARRDGDEFGVRRSLDRGNVTPRNVTNSDEAKVKCHVTSRI